MMAKLSLSGMVKAKLSIQGFQAASNGRFWRRLQGQTHFVEIQRGMLNKEFTFNIGITFDGVPSAMHFQDINLEKADVLDFCVYQRVGKLTGTRHDLWWSTSNWPEIVDATNCITKVCRRALTRCLSKWGDGTGLLESIQFGRKSGEPHLGRTERHWYEISGFPMEPLTLLALLRDRVDLAVQLEQQLTCPSRDFVSAKARILRNT